MSNSVEMSPISKTESKAINDSFSLQCALDNKGITNLALDNMSLIANGKINTEKHLNPSAIKIYKKDLEAEHKKSFPNYKNFTIESTKDGMRLKPSGLRKIMPFRSSIQLSPEVTKRILTIQDSFNTNNIFGKTAINNIKQLKATPKTNTILSILLLSVLTVGVLAGTIGLGGLLPLIGGAVASFGIVGIPMSVTIGLLSAGALSIVAYGALYIASKKSKVANEYLKDIHYKKSQAFLESNINDFAGGAYLTLLAMTFLKFPFKSILAGCLQYPGGILTVASGIYQLVESIKALINAKAINNKEALLKASLNIIYSFIVAGLGIVITMGLLNSPIGIALALGVGLLSLFVAALNFKNSAKQLRDVYKVDENNASEIIKFLKNNLSLNDVEIQKVKDKTQAMTKANCTTWIKNNMKNFDAKQKAKWEEIEEKLTTAKETEIDEIKKLILREEIKNTQERKIENFGALIKKDTLIETLETLENSIDDDEKIKAVFKKIKKDTRNKTIAEFAKIFMINIPMMVIPMAQPLMSLALYDMLLASTFFFNVLVNLNPSYRNIPPTMLKKALDINKKLNAYPISKDTKNPTVKKVKKVVKKPNIKAA